MEEQLIEEQLPKKYRCFTLVVYDDSIHYKLEDIFFALKGFKYWAYIKHKPEDDEKQPHYHILISFIRNTKNRQFYRDGD